MKVHNSTHWQTKDLARIARRVLTLETTGKPERRARAASLVLTIGYNRGNGRFYKTSSSSGHARIGGRYLTVNVPSHDVDPLDFAFLVGHELGHIWGFTHEQMYRVLHYERGGPANARYAWARDIPILKRVERRTRPTSDGKLAHAQAMLKVAHTRAKRAQTLVTKWRRKVRYYERRVSVGLPVAASKTVDINTPVT